MCCTFKRFHSITLPLTKSHNSGQCVLLRIVVFTPFCGLLLPCLEEEMHKKYMEQWRCCVRSVTNTQVEFRVLCLCCEAFCKTSSISLQAGESIAVWFACIVGGGHKGTRTGTSSDPLTSYINHGCGHARGCSGVCVCVRVSAYCLLFSTAWHSESPLPLNRWGSILWSLNSQHWPDGGAYQLLCVSDSVSV